MLIVIVTMAKNYSKVVTISMGINPGKGRESI